MKIVPTKYAISYFLFVISANMRTMTASSTVRQIVNMQPQQLTISLFWVRIVFPVTNKERRQSLTCQHENYRFAVAEAKLAQTPPLSVCPHELWAKTVNGLRAADRVAPPIYYSDTAGAFLCAD